MAYRVVINVEIFGVVQRRVDSEFPRGGAVLRELQTRASVRGRIRRNGYVRMRRPDEIAVADTDARTRYDDRFGILFYGLVGIVHDGVPVGRLQLRTGRRLRERRVGGEEYPAGCGKEERRGEEFERFGSHGGLSVIGYAFFGSSQFTIHLVPNLSVSDP